MCRFHVAAKRNFPPLVDQHLRSTERLKSRKQIQALFAEGQSVKAYPLRLVYLLSAASAESSEPPLQIGFVASKRSFRRAVDRNAIKRRMREAFRLDKAALYTWLETDKLELRCMLIYTGRDLPRQRDITKAWSKLLRRLRSSDTA